MAPKIPGEGPHGDEIARDYEDSGARMLRETESNLVFPRKYANRLQKVSEESETRLEDARIEAIKDIDRDLEALARTDHGLDPDVVDSFVALLKVARQELAGSERLSLEQAQYLQATGRRLERLVAEIKQNARPRSDD